MKALPTLDLRGMGVHEQQTSFHNPAWQGEHLIVALALDRVRRHISLAFCLVVCGNLFCSESASHNPKLADKPPCRHSEADGNVQPCIGLVPSTRESEP